MGIMDGVRDARPAAAAGAGAPPLRLADDWERLAYLREVCELLWPPTAEMTLYGGSHGWPQITGAVRPRALGGNSRADGRDFVLIPGVRHPRLLVPAAPRAAAAALRQYGQPRSWAARMGVAAFALGLASGLGGTLLGVRVRVTAPPEAESIESYLKSVLSPDIRVSIRLGPARANRKPVLQLHTTSGKAAGFVKIGFNALTRDLVRAEAASLAWLESAGLDGISVPRVIHHSQWHGMDVLVLSGLPVWQRRRGLSAAQLSAAMETVARVGGLQEGALASDAYLLQLRERLETADPGPERSALLDALDAISATGLCTSLTFGAWHGDWSPWNMASTTGGLLVWDWERFASGVPLGFDALHYWLQTEVGPQHRDPLAAAIDCLEHAAALLAPFGIEPARARLTAALYLADVATRYLVDRQAAAGAPLGAPGTWLIPALVGEMPRFRAQQNGKH
jgi:Phosphotransferase enzyme family